jgi:hypothetical protein
MRSVISVFLVLAVAVLLFPCLYAETAVGSAVSNDKAAQVTGAQCWYALMQYKWYCAPNTTHYLCFGNCGYVSVPYITPTLMGMTSITGSCPCCKGSWYELSNAYCYSPYSTIASQ